MSTEKSTPASPTFFVVAKTTGGYTRECKVEIQIIGLFDNEDVAEKVRLTCAGTVLPIQLNALAPGLLVNAAELLGKDSPGFQLLASKIIPA